MMGEEGKKISGTAAACESSRLVCRTEGRRKEKASLNGMQFSPGERLQKEVERTKLSSLAELDRESERDL
jgi:hypothetical protein